MQIVKRTAETPNAKATKHAEGVETKKNETKKRKRKTTKRNQTKPNTTKSLNKHKDLAFLIFTLFSQQERQTQ